MAMDRPLIGLTVCIRKDDKILMHKRKGKHAPGTWAFPGGHFEKWETFESCALRELKEEAGDITIKNLHFWRVANTMFKDEDRHYVVIIMVADWVSGEPRVMEPDKCECWEWVDWYNPPEPLMLGIQMLQQEGANPFYEN